MINFKSEISQLISNIIQINKKEIEEYIEIPKENKNGDYTFPCFRLAKTLKKAPQIIANDIKEKMQIEGTIINNIEVINGYLNFYINKKILVQNVLEEISKKEELYGSSEEGKGKTVVIDYSAPNIAKPFHIGHLRTTVIGASLYNIYKFFGYTTIGINHLGDWGTQFGKLIEGYKRWGNEYDVDKNPIEELTKIYIRINNECKEDETILEECRNNFKKLEEKDPYCVSLWKKFREVSLKEFQKTYDLLGTKFDSWNGEAFYIDKTKEVIEILENTGRLVESEGAKVVELEDKDMPPCIVFKSNGSTIYATRDLAAILYRARTYDFDKIIYVVSYEQTLYFKQLFEVAKLLGLDKKYTDKMVHVPFGMVRLKTGKMSTREGNTIKLDELLNESITRVRAIIEEKQQILSEEEKEDISKKVGIGAVIFNDLANNRIKDEIFDLDTMLNFQGETGPYIQYIYVRTKSVLEKAGYMPRIEEIDFEELLDEKSINVIQKIYDFENIIRQSLEKNEPSIISRYLIDISQEYSAFYNDNKVLVEDKKIQNARLYLTYSVGVIIKTGARLLGIEMPDKM